GRGSDQDTLAPGVAPRALARGRRQGHEDPGLDGAASPVADQRPRHADERAGRRRNGPQLRVRGAPLLVRDAAWQAEGAVEAAEPRLERAGVALPGDRKSAGAG